MRQVERELEVAEGHGRGLCLQWRGGGVLPTGHPVDEVVYQDHQQVDVSPGRVNEVVASYPHQIPVSGEDRYRQLRPTELQPDGERNGAALGSNGG